MPNEEKKDRGGQGNQSGQKKGGSKQQQEQGQKKDTGKSTSK